jgi:hypothetical protein
MLFASGRQGRPVMKVVEVNLATWSDRVLRVAISAARDSSGPTRSQGASRVTDATNGNPRRYWKSVSQTCNETQTSTEYLKL